MTVCLVTGGAGFIGSHLVGALVRQGHTVRVLDNFSTGSYANLDEVRSHIELIEGDLCDAATLKAATEGAEIVFHQAALASVSRSLSDPLATHQVCATGTLLLLLAARDAGVRRVIYAASSSAYGDAEKLPRRESDALRPVSPYAVAKLAGEKYCQVFSTLYGMETVRLRYFNVFGPRQSPDSPYAPVIPLFLQALLHGRNPVVHGDGRQSRDFTYVDDVVQANLLAAKAQRVSGKVYNVAFGQQTSLLELIAHANELLGTNIKPIFAPPRQGDVRHSLADTSLAQTDLGFCPCIDVVQGLEQCIAHLRGRFEGNGLGLGGPHNLGASLPTRT
jgi:UDP-glucose 4-epimerase